MSDTAFTDNTTTTGAGAATTPAMNKNAATGGTGGNNGDALDKGIDYLERKQGHEMVG